MAEYIVFFPMYCAGLVGWTLYEYLFHRFLGHRRRIHSTITREHLRHHADPTYFTPVKKKILLALPVLGLLALVGNLATSLAGGVGLALGLASGWLAYEALHRRMHLGPAQTRIGRLLQRHHIAHHFGHPRANHGVTSPLWDFLAGTHQSSGELVAPPKLRGHLSRLGFRVSE